MLNEVPPSSHGINLQYRVDGGLFDLARFRAKSKTSTITAHELQFSDDNATPAQPFDDLCRIATIYNVSYQHFGMEVNTDKTKVHIQPPPGQTLSRTNDGINGEHLGKVDYFPVLAAFSQKLQRVQRTLAIAWKLHTVHMGALVTGSSTTMRYPSAPKSWFSGPPFFLPFSVCETWTLYRRDIKRLDSFQQRKLRQLLNTRWELRLSNNEIHKRARLPSVEATILRWAGHIVRMDPFRQPRIMLYDELDELHWRNKSPWRTKAAL